MAERPGMRPFPLAYKRMQSYPQVTRQYAFLPQVISFYFEYLGHEKYESCMFCFVPGATTFLLINAGVQPEKKYSPVPVLAESKDKILTQYPFRLPNCVCCAQALRMPQGWQSH